MLFAGKSYRLHIIIIGVRYEFTLKIIVASAFKTAHGFLFCLFLGKSEIHLVKAVLSDTGLSLRHFLPRRLGHF